MPEKDDPYAFNDGAIGPNGYDVGYTKCAVRPAMYVDLSSGVF